MVTEANPSPRPLAPHEPVDTRRLYDAVATLSSNLMTLTKAHNELQQRVQQAASTAQQTQQKVSSLPSFDVLQSGTSTQLKNQASALPAHCTGMTYVATSSGITFYWDGTNGSQQIQIAWPDGSMTNVPLGNLAVSGLAASTTYYFYPAYSTSLNAVLFSPQGCPSTCPPGTGTPAVAYPAANIFAAAGQDGDRNTSLSDGPIVITLPASGSTSGSVGGK